MSATVIVVYYDEELWNKFWSLVVELYEPEKPTIPTKLHKSLPDIRRSISSSKKTHTHLMCEVPTITGENMETLQYLEMYIHHMPQHL